jgi:hypothetical protein
MLQPLFEIICNVTANCWLKEASLDSSMPYNLFSAFKNDFNNLQDDGNDLLVQ